MLGCYMKQNILPFRGSYYPVLGQLLHEINVAGEINKVINVQDTQANIDVGTFTCLMILNILGDVNIRLYRMGEFFEDKALPLMIPWRPDIYVDEITDDRAARVLDILWNADPQKIFSAVTHAAIRIHNLDISVIHGDTTSKSFIGAFENSEENGLAPWITHGYSKDHRPDLKQLIFGVGSTADGGVPILAEITDGNESDKTLNGRWVTQLRSLLGKNNVEEFLLYIADSALITTDNLTLMEKYHIDFISRLPGTFTLEEQLKRTAFQQNTWVSLGKLSEEKTAAVYHVCDMTKEINNKTYRFVVVKSSQKDQRKLKAMDATVQREHHQITKLLQTLSKRPFACRRDAEIETKKIRTKHTIHYHQINWIITETQEHVKRNQRGRPKKTEAISIQTQYYLTGKLRRDDTLYEQERELCGLFVLITSLKDTTKHSAQTILERYKGQGTIERIFKFIKNPSWIGSFCLKKPERLTALGYVLLIAAMIYTLWERRVRNKLTNKDTKPIEGLNKKKTTKPTTFALQTILTSIMVLSQIQGGEWRIWLPKPLTTNQKHILELSGFNEDIYIWKRKNTFT